MLPPADLASMAGLLPAITGVVLVILAARLHRLFSTGFSFWSFLAAGAIALSALASCLAGFSDGAAAVTDVSMLVAGFSVYAASRWLRERFELVGKHGR
ncbi:hypothetical protein [Methanocella sp. MCL-LM]|uniref:hypothetical protein n=1 Tax=Methanocella sp. MCL-LM TaxID=3412035 RepID=UPI003C72B70B